MSDETDSGVPLQPQPESTGSPGIEDRSAALNRLHRDQYRDLVRLAYLVVRDQGLAEEAAQDGFLAVFQAWERVVDPRKRLAYLRSSVLNAARNRVGREVRARSLREVGEWVPSAASQVEVTDRRRRIVELVRGLPRRQQEVVLLRYFLDLSEVEIAETLGISQGSVKTHAHRALRQLETLLGGER